MVNDSQSRKWLITINNPLDKGFSHDAIRDSLAQLKSCIYWCMSDEVGLETHTPHTHIFIACSSAVRFSTLQHRFPSCHFDMCRGTSAQNRDYVFKTGKYLNSPKEDTKIADTQEEWGEMPVERQGRRNDMDDLFDMVKAGMSDYEILHIAPEYMLNLSAIRDTRQIVNQEYYKTTFRQLEVTYIYGHTGAGKTRYVMEKYGYENVYRITNYKHPFDAYKNQDVILFDEFRSSLMLCDMLKYLDGYPLDLPCRYNDKQATYTKVYFATNIILEQQYPEVQKSESESWDAFLRRIHRVMMFKKSGREEYTTKDYLKRFIEIDDDEYGQMDIPFNV